MKLLKFAASWCAPCKMLSKTFEDVNHPLKDTMENIDIDEDQSKAMLYNVRGVPTMVLIDDMGNEVKRVSGYKNKDQILEFLN